MQSVHPQGLLFSLDSDAKARPFLKWAGGKSRLLSILRVSIPPNQFGRYFEPFLGGGALFFDLALHDAVLCDSNPELISWYKVLRGFPGCAHRQLSRYQVNECEFYRIRVLRPEEMNPRTSPRFIYLTLSQLGTC